MDAAENPYDYDADVPPMYPEECAYCGEPFDVGSPPIQTSHGFYCSRKCKRRAAAQIEDMLAYESLVNNAEPIDSPSLMTEVHEEAPDDWDA